MKPQPENERQSRGLARPGKCKLLLVDEDLDDLRVYSNVLGHMGYDVHSFNSYGEAAATVGNEAFDLVIVSQGTSNFEGRRVLARAIEKDRHTPVLILTNSVEIPCYLEAMQLGALDYLERPLSPSEIGELVAKHLQVKPGQA
jgi:DNA-binding NtrC family response regulator